MMQCLCPPVVCEVSVELVFTCLRVELVFTRLRVELVLLAKAERDRNAETSIDSQSLLAYDSRASFSIFARLATVITCADSCVSW